MSFTSHFVVNDSYLKGEKIRTSVLFWVIPNKFEEEQVNDYLCCGHKEFHILHKLKAGYYDSSDCKKCHQYGCDAKCLDEICSFVKKLYPDYDFYGSKLYLKNNYRRKTCVDVDVKCQSGKNPVRK